MLALLIAVGGSFGECQDDEVPADIREFRGNPSSWFCGQRWSHDHESVACDGGAFFFDLHDLARFERLRSVRISDTVVFDEAVPLPRVEQLVLSGVTVSGDVIASAFPNLESLLVSGSEFDVSSLPPMPRLSDINVHLAPPPRVDAIVRQPALRDLMLSYLMCDACENRIADEVRALRPDIEVETYRR